MLEHPLIWLAARALGSWVLVLIGGAALLSGLWALTAPARRFRAYQRTRAFLPEAKRIFILALIGDECLAFSGLCLNVLLIAVYAYQMVACVVVGMILLLVADATSRSSGNLFRSEIKAVRDRLPMDDIDRRLR
jgi:hypothetical protein